MAEALDLLKQINNAILDLQAAQLNSISRPLGTLARLLKHPDLAEINDKLTAAVDYDAFLAASEQTGGGMVGSGHLVWPDDMAHCLGLTLVMIDRLAADPERRVLDLTHDYYYASGSIDRTINRFVREVIIPFGRDYKSYIQNQASAEANLIMPASNKVFVVHGHDEEAKEGLARFIEKLGLEAIVLGEQPNQGRTIVEKFEDFAREVGFAVVLLTPDDLGSAVLDADQSSRARQNVIFELGYFAGKLGRGRVCLVRKGAVEMPSDLYGIVYTEMDTAGAWRQRLVAELKAAKLDFDANRMWL